MTHHLPHATQPTRQFTPYEETQLARAGLSTIDRSTIGSQPIEYVTGISEFGGYLFQVSPAVLIPRIETEELVGKVVESVWHRWHTTSKPIKLREVGTGSGAIGITILLELIKKGLPATALGVDLSDISPAAVAVAKINLTNLVPQEFHAPFTLFVSDLLVVPDQPKLAHQYDILVSNLPYIPTSRLSKLDDSVKNHEPLLALDGGTDGFALIAMLLIQAPNFLKPHGEVWLEVDHTHTLEFISTHYPDLAKIYSWKSFVDSFGRQRFLQAIPNVNYIST